MKVVIQEELTGCAIASTALLAGINYKEAQKVANTMEIYADDKALWSETLYIRKLLSSFKIKTDKNETSFTTWDKLPDLALLAINWHLEENKPFWHWVVFVREGNEQYIIDSSPRLQNNVRKDFKHIEPKWYIEVTQPIK